MSLLEGLVRDMVKEEMEKANMHPEAVKHEVTDYTAAIEDLLKNINSDDELEEIETYLHAIEETVEVQKDAHDEVRKDEMDAYNNYKKQVKENIIGQPATATTSKLHDKYIRRMMEGHIQKLREADDE